MIAGAASPTHSPTHHATLCNTCRFLIKRTYNIPSTNPYCLPLPPPCPYPLPPCQPPSGLRNLQARQQLQDLVSFVCAARDNLPWGPRGPPPLLVKVAPDLSDGEKADVAAVVLASRVDGLVVGNTTISRPGGWVK
jgi:hypothetical protein